MIIHSSILKISDLAIPFHPGIGMNTSNILISNNHSYCEQLLDDLHTKFNFILDDIEKMISSHNELIYEDISNYLINKYENEIYIEFNSKLRKFILVSFFSSEVTLGRLKLTYSINEIKEKDCFYGKISEYLSLLPNKPSHKNDK
tara:strand:- start:57 stop:491 length:435 start_codon:yes stop_codon:yes gene_type:complete